MDNKSKGKKIIAGVGLILLMLGIAGCSKQISQPETEKSETKDLVLHLAGGDNGLPNPFRHTPRGPGMAKMQLLYDSLLEKDENGIIPWLAKSWDINEDGTVYTFHLQENACWHDGEPLTAEDVAFTFTYEKEHPPVVNDLLVGEEYMVTQTNVIDDHTVEVTLNHFDNTFLEKIGSVRILPKHIWEQVSDPASYDGEDAVIGSGPYQLESYDAGQGAYRYTAFEDYWGLKSAAKAIEWIPVSDQVLAFENEEIDLINATADLLPKYQSDSNNTVKTSPSFHSYRLMMNMEAVPELQDRNLRKALAYGIDRQELVDKVARGSASISSMGYVPTYSKWYNKEIEQYDYNQDKARELLGGKTYQFVLLTDNSQSGIKAAELIKLSLEKIGVEVTVESVESKTRDNAIKTGEYELLLVNYGGLGGDPDYLRSYFGKDSGTIPGWSNDEIYALIEKQAVEPDEEKRKEIVDKLQGEIADEVPMIMLFGMKDNFVYRSNYYNGWMFRYDHSKCDHNKLSYLIRQ